MDTTREVFVIIPVYNAGAYVAQALNSVLEQPYQNIHIICVDDGSTDDSISVLRDYEKRHCNVHVIRKKNGGVSSARNSGIEYVLDHCTNTDYLTFLDADDLWAKSIITPLSVNNYFDADCVGFSSIRCSNDLSGVTMPNKLIPQCLPGGQESIWCHGDSHMGAVFYSCRMIQRFHIRFLENLKYSEDKQFKYTCMYLAEQIRLIEQVLYCYRANYSGAIHSRKFGIEYMLPIIHGYLKTDAFLKPYENSIRGKASFARLLAGIHVLEMIEEHYQSFGSKAALSSAFEADPVLTGLLHDLRKAPLTERVQRIYDEYFHNTSAFIFRCRITGLKLSISRMILKSRLFNRILEKKRYSLPNIYL